MFDLSRITETLSSLVGANQEPEQANLPEVLQNVGLDPSILTGLSQTEIGSLLASYGIDISQLPEGEIAQFAERLDLGQAAGLISAPWGGGASEN